MPKHALRIMALATAVLAAAAGAEPDTWRLDPNQDLQPVEQDEFLLAVAEAKHLVYSGQTDAARTAYENLKADFPDINEPAFNIFVDAELLFSQAEFTKAYRLYEKLFKEHPRSRLRQVALDRQFAIATAYLGGEKKKILRFIKLKGDATGIKIMERVTEHAGIDTPMGLNAARAVAQNYEKRKLFYDAELKWYEISAFWSGQGPIGKQALLARARSNHAAYNAQPEEKRALYDDSTLRTAKTHYENFTLRYPEDAERIGVDRVIRQMDEQLAEKQLAVAKYYHRAGKIVAANLYYDMVLTDWPNSKAARSIELIRASGPDF